jgi:DNA-binding NarL/FixJ family response regulator
MTSDIQAIQRGFRVVSLLLVEDNPADVALFEELLEQVEDFKFSLTNVASLRGAIELAANESFDCIVLDLNLPDSQGLQTYREMRKHAPATAMVILSGRSEREIMLRALRDGADNYLIKGSCDGNRIAIAILSAMRNYVDTENSADFLQSASKDTFA